MSKVIFTSLAICMAGLALPLEAKGLLGGPARDVSATRAVAFAGVSLDQAVAMVQSKYRARVNRAVTTERGGRVVHEIRLISADGSRVWTVHDDAATGREL